MRRLAPAATDTWSKNSSAPCVSPYWGAGIGAPFLNPTAEAATLVEAMTTTLEARAPATPRPTRGCANLQARRDGHGLVVERLLGSRGGWKV